ncbi:MAG: fibronectin type III domain-containing protein [Acidimicrobiales bacterium]
MTLLTIKANVGPPVPVIASLPAKVQASAPAGDSVLVLNGSGTTDPDTNPTQPLAYQWEQIDPSTGEPIADGSPAQGTFGTPTSVNTTWTAPSTAPHSVQFRLTVTDGISLPVSQTSPAVKVTTKRAGADAGPDQLVNPEQEVHLDGAGSYDEGGRPLTYSWRQTSGPVVELANRFGTSPSFTTPYLASGDTAQSFTFELTTRNGLAASYDTVTVVNQPYDLALADAGDDQTVDTGTEVQLDGSGSLSPSGTDLTYEWSQVSGPSVSLSDATSASPTFTAPPVSQAQGPQDVVLELVVTDDYGTSVADSVTITVDPVLEVPYADRRGGHPGNGTATVTFTPGIDGGSPVLVFVVTCTSPTGVTRSTFAGPAGDGQRPHQRGALHLRGLRRERHRRRGRLGALGGGAPGGPALGPDRRVGGAGGQRGRAGGLHARVERRRAVHDLRRGLLLEQRRRGQGRVLRPRPRHPRRAHQRQDLHLHGDGGPRPRRVAHLGALGPAGGRRAAGARHGVGHPGDGSATVTWAAAANSGSAVTSYTVTPYLNGVAQPPVVVAGTVTSVTVASLANSASYSFDVQATNSRGPGPVSARSSW